jgi:hypothetical protein
LQAGIPQTLRDGLKEIHLGIIGFFTPYAVPGQFRNPFGFKFTFFKVV